MPSKQSVQRWNKQTNKQTDSQTDKLPGSVQVYELPKLTVNFADGTELSCLKKKHEGRAAEESDEVPEAPE